MGAEGRCHLADVDARQHDSENHQKFIRPD
jgi:hypothetical protein